MLPHVACGLLDHLSETQTPPDLGVFVSMVASWYHISFDPEVFKPFQ